MPSYTPTVSRAVLAASTGRPHQNDPGAGRSHGTDLPDVTLASAFEQAVDGVALVRADGVILYANPAYCRSVEHTAGCAIGSDIRRLEPWLAEGGDDADPFAATLAGEPFVATGARERADGAAVWEEMSVSPFHDASDEGLSGFLVVKRDPLAHGRTRGGLDWETGDRLTVAASMARLGGAGAGEEAARLMVREAARLPTVRGVAVLAMGSAGECTVLARSGRSTTELDGLFVVSEPIARYLYGRARRGSWIEDAAGGDSLVGASVLPGVRRVGFAPIRYGGTLVGIVAVGMIDDDTAEGRRQRAVAREFAALAGPVLGPTLRDRAREERRRNRIVDVIERGAFEAVFQPVVDLLSAAPIGFEALTRFHDGERPDVRFLAADALGLGEDLEMACIRRQIVAAEALPAGTWLSMNVSPRLLCEQAGLADALREADRPIILELTEHAAIEDYAWLRASIERLPRGTRIAVDDAGAGYAGLGRILEIRPHFVKLDIGVVRSLERDPARQALVTGMRHFAINTGCELIAEGVETRAERQSLIRLGVRFGQGYLLGRPSEARAWTADGSTATTPEREHRPAADPGAETGTDLNSPATVLLVEDEALLRSLTAEILRREGYRVLVAADGVEALRLMRDETVMPDLLLSDIVMPGQMGPEIAGRLVELRPSLRVLYMSGMTEPVDFGDGPTAMGLVRKPFTVDELISQVRAALKDSSAPPV